MELERGQVAVVTGGGSGIGRALAEAFASAGLHLVLADVDAEGMAATQERVNASGVECLLVPTDVSKEAEVQALAAATLERFGAVHVVCNNAGVSARTDVWFGPISAWEWTMGVNFFGVVHGVRAFLPHLVGGGHIVNTASIAGLMTGFSAPYDASKHAVVAVSEDLYVEMRGAGLPVGVSVLCPGWVNTQILDADRNWPSELGARPELSAAFDVTNKHVRRALAEGLTPAAAAEAVVAAVQEDRFWVLPQDDFFELAVKRWERMAEKLNPEPPDQMPGMPPREQLMAEVFAALFPDAEPPAPQ